MKMPSYAAVRGRTVVTQARSSGSGEDIDFDKVLSDLADKVGASTFLIAPVSSGSSAGVALHHFG